METEENISVVVPFGNMDEPSLEEIVKFGSRVVESGVDEVLLSVDDVKSVSRVSGELSLGTVLVSCSSVVAGGSEDSLEGDGLVMVSSVCPSVEIVALDVGSEGDEEVESGSVSGGVIVCELTASVVNVLDDNPSSGVVIELSKSPGLEVVSASIVASDVFGSALFVV